MLPPVSINTNETIFIGLFFSLFLITLIFMIFYPSENKIDNIYKKLKEEDKEKIKDSSGVKNNKEKIPKNDFKNNIPKNDFKNNIPKGNIKSSIAKLNTINEV